jgi:hypothetical protein
MKQKTPPPSPQEEPLEESQKRSRRRKLWEWSEFGERSGWEWMQLLIILFVVGVAGL